MRSVLFVVNTLATLVPTQTTAALVAACADRVPVWLTVGDGFCLTPRGLRVAAWRVGPGVADRLPQLRAAPPQLLPLAEIGAVWVRTNPGRAHRPVTPALQMLLQVEDAGIPVRNSPAGLVRAATKLHLGVLPAGTVPRTWSAADARELERFLDQLGGPAVVKPVRGTQGSGVQRVSPDHPDRTRILQRAVANGPALLQDYIPAAPEGDVRIHVVGGALLERDGQACAVRRVPARGEWRSNVALGGRPTPATLTPAQRALVTQVSPILREQGLWHVGLDVVGDQIVECNVFSPGGLQDAGAFAGVDFVAEVVERFLTDAP